MLRGLRGCHRGPRAIHGADRCLTRIVRRAAQHEGQLGSSSHNTSFCLSYRLNTTALFHELQPGALSLECSGSQANVIRTPTIEHIGKTYLLLTESRLGCSHVIDTTASHEQRQLRFRGGESGARLN